MKNNTNTNQINSYKHLVSIIEVLPNYGLRLEFEDNEVHDVDCTDMVNDTRYAPDSEGGQLKSPEYFSQVMIRDGFILCWPNGFDVAPDWLYKAATTTGKL